MLKVTENHNWRRDSGGNNFVPIRSFLESRSLQTQWQEPPLIYSSERVITLARPPTVLLNSPPPPRPATSSTFTRKPEAATLGNAGRTAHQKRLGRATRIDYVTAFVAQGRRQSQERIELI